MSTITPKFLFTLRDGDDIIIHLFEDNSFNDAVISTDQYVNGIYNSFLFGKGIYIEYPHGRQIGSDMKIRQQFLYFDAYGDRNNINGWEAYEVIR